MTDLAKIKLTALAFTPSHLIDLKLEAWKNKRADLFWEFAAAEDLQLFLKTKDLIWWRMMVLAIREARDYYKMYPDEKSM